MSKMAKLVCGIGLLGMLGLGTACSPTSADGVRANFSPELHSTARSFEQHRNMEARAIDLNGRQMWDDGARFLLVDRPSRLSPYPMP